MNKKRRFRHKSIDFEKAWERQDLGSSLASLVSESGPITSYIKKIYPEMEDSDIQDLTQEITIWLWSILPKWIGKSSSYVRVALYNKIRNMSTEESKLDLKYDPERTFPSVESVLIDLERELDRNKNIDLAVSSMHPRFGQTIKEILSGSLVSFGDKSQKWRHVRAAIERFRLRWEALDLEFQKR